MRLYAEKSRCSVRAMRVAVRGSRCKPNAWYAGVSVLLGFGHRRKCLGKLEGLRTHRQMASSRHRCSLGRDIRVHAERKLQAWALIGITTAVKSPVTSVSMTR